MATIAELQAMVDCAGEGTPLNRPHISIPVSDLKMLLDKIALIAEDEAHERKA